MAVNKYPLTFSIWQQNTWPTQLSKVFRYSVSHSFHIQTFLKLVSPNCIDRKETRNSIVQQFLLSKYLASCQEISQLPEMSFEKGRPVAPNQTHTNRAHILKLHLFKIRFNIILSPVLSLTFRFSVLNLITHFSSYSVKSVHPEHFILPDLIAMVKWTVKHLICYFLHFPVMSPQ